MAYCLTNSERSMYRFTVAPAEHFGAWRHAERNGWHLSGSFHSHPASPPVPSGPDIEGALDPSWVYLIAGPADTDEMDIRGYRIRDGSAHEIALDVVATP